MQLLDYLTACVVCPFGGLFSDIISLCSQYCGYNLTLIDKNDGHEKNTTKVVKSVKLLRYFSVLCFILSTTT